jgi:hypothetical protein
LYFVVLKNNWKIKMVNVSISEVSGDWRKLHNEELHILYSSPNIIRRFKSRRMRWAGHVACMGKERKVYKVLVGKPEGKRPLGRPSHRWKDGIRLDLRAIGWGSVEWIYLVQDRGRKRNLVNAVMNLRVLEPRIQLNVSEGPRKIVTVFYFKNNNCS